MPLATGMRLGPYEILAPIGAGGMGEVYRARDTRLNRDVALKILPHALAQDPDRLRRFYQEAQAAGSLNHPNIMAVYDLGQSDGVTYVISELLEGETLRQRLSAGLLGVPKAIEYAVQIARGLAAAHAKGIAHRDIKPENLFITRDGFVKILDFGLAKVASSGTALETGAPTDTMETGPGVVMGTAGYMAPEQVRADATDHRCDIFSLGAVLYEMLAGRRAFAGQTAAEKMSAILKDDPADLPASVPAGLRGIVRRCLEKRPGERFESARDLAFALESASTLERSEDLGRPPRRRWPALAAATALVALLIGLAVFFWHSRPPPGLSEWMQLTRLADSATQPALSPDGRMLTFVRGRDTFAADGQIYVKMLPGGESVELTHDNLQKMSPVFSPDGSQIAYTTAERVNGWNTWVVQVVNGQPRRWLPNASGLVWFGKRQILFSEIKNNDVHMAIVMADESRAGERDIYVPASERAMAHRSYPNADGTWALVVEMDARAQWLPCRLVALDGHTPGRQVGPPGAGCTFGAWSPDGKWMYLSSSAGGAFHTWRQRFPDGQPQQITSGPTEEEGIAMAADGRSFVTSVGLKQSAVWLHDSAGERKVSIEGYCYDPKFTPDGKRLFYRVLKGTFPTWDSSELQVIDVDSARSEPFLAGFAVFGNYSAAYDISPDGQQVVLSAHDPDGKHRIWLAPVDRSSPPHPIPNVEGDHPLFGKAGEIFFRANESGVNFAYAVRSDGTGLRKAIEQPVVLLENISPGGELLLARVPRAAGASVTAFPLTGGSPVDISPAGFVGVFLKWAASGKSVFVSVPGAMFQEHGGRTYEVPLLPGALLPPIPPGGFQSEAAIAHLAGARLIDAFDAVPGPTPQVYAFGRETVQRNLYRIPIP